MPRRIPEQDGTPAEKIPLAELEAMLLDPDVPDSDIRPYLMLDDSGTRSYRPEIRVNPSKIEEAGPADGAVPESAMFLSSLNGVARWRRQQRYREKVENWNGLRIVSEGDSWFQFPFLLDDVIDQLFGDYAIFSLDAAGDLLSDMISQNELIGAVAAEKPDFVFLSGGGNDLLGSGRLTRHIEPFRPGRPAADYLGAPFERFLASVMADYRRIVSQLRRAAPNVQVLVHSYARAIPNGGRWLGQPMTQAGIRDPGLQREIVSAILERFHAALLGLAQEPGSLGHVHVVDCRDHVGDHRWWDELHPTSEGFASVAARFRAAVKERTASPVEGAATESIAVMAEAPSADAEAVLQLASLHDDAVLYREIGRRMTLASLAGPGIEQSATAVPASSLEGALDDFFLLGRRIVARLHRELFGLLCGASEADKADRTALREAIGVGEAALAAYLVGLLTGGAFALPAVVAAPVAALLMRRFFAATWEETCTLCGEKIGAAGGAPEAAFDLSPHMPAMRTPAARKEAGARPETKPRPPSKPDRQR
jgi:lysophospholipase L1-like esterase